ncbi:MULTISPECIES: NAD(P)-dependent oxidoreductase [Streptomyces]|uniref:NAD-dependent epimerase/dehydratase family protein n=1 Tax=Streptomyces TaxID=1883 RepID=UPI001CCF7635|nr:MULTISPECIES: NAD(P)-dependent oxidoreductase [Streptomyces]MBZ6176435.1 NAD(P)-dependent oxidoreductase [Streptomyces olivaceus]MBZ6183491.1 NAD(P)-dependent oxidoreductase [Streptomyces olivaceus]WFB82562.1 NAD(P)-dependent oxidoreductase [Streptomyces olivaceus]WGK44898.1 NAD(P)-dependent oxidoreductase [Streptomyces sp. B146]
MKAFLTGVAGLQEELARPGPGLVDEARTWTGDVLVLGAGGKTGSGIAAMARRALTAADRTGSRVLAVSRWTDAEARDQLAAYGVETVTADLSDPDALAALPDAGAVIHLVGAKFGTAGAPEQAWMTNTVLPDHVARRWPAARIVALSTGNVYGMTAPVTGGSLETDPPRPEGDYALTCLGRERVLTHAAVTRGTPVALIRLNYAVEPRYGVLADLARTLLAGRPVALDTGAVNIVWQRYANEVVLRAIGHATGGAPFVLNLTGPETAGVRTLAQRLAELLDVKAEYTGEPAATSLLSDATACHALFGYPDRTLGELVEMQAAWLRAGGRLWDKPTKFERRDGRF